MLRRAIDWATTDWALKVTALALAFLMWVTVRADAPGQWTTEVPVRVTNNDGGWVVAEPPRPAAVSVTFRGSYRELLRATSPPPEFVIPIQEVTDSIELRELRADWLRLSPGTDGVVGQFPRYTIELSFDRITTRLIPLAAPMLGEPPVGFEVGTVEIEPIVVRASGAARALARMDSLRLPPIDLRGRRAYDTLELSIDTTGTGLIVSPRTVRVFVPVRRISADTSAPPVQQPPPHD